MNAWERCLLSWKQFVDCKYKPLFLKVSELKAFFNAQESAFLSGIRKIDLKAVFCEEIPGYILMKLAYFYKSVSDLEDLDKKRKIEYNVVKRYSTLILVLHSINVELLIAANC